MSSSPRQDLHSGPDGKARCGWVTDDPAYLRYHDEEWGRPVHDDQRLFEMLILEGAQAGLSWLTILRKRESYRQAFRGFDPARVARFTARDTQRLLANPGIVRNRLKIEASLVNARATLKLLESHGSLDAFLWQFVDGTPRNPRYRRLADIPARSAESDAMSLALKKAGFKFVGSTICYAFMQAVGMTNDHLVSCWKAEIRPGRRDRS
jgi:DNA-3-methyladenine glycosylase I